MAHKARMKAAKSSRGAVRGGISQKRANAGHRKRVVPMAQLLGEQPLEKPIV